MMTSYRGAKVIVVPLAPNTSQPKWIASWVADQYENITIFVETQYANAIRRHSMNDHLCETLEHEYLEAIISIDKALEYMHENHIPKSQLPAIAQRFAGKAHELTIYQMHGMDRYRYNKKLDSELRSLELL